jgi:hypothetical protein
MHDPMEAIDQLEPEEGLLFKGTNQVSAVKAPKSRRAKPANRSRTAINRRMVWLAEGLESVIVSWLRVPAKEHR